MVELDFLPESIKNVFYDPVTGNITPAHIIADIALVLIPLSVVIILWWWLRKKTKE